jgi:CRISPR-associated RAMP protein (TIGR02581 family)
MTMVYGDFDRIDSLYIINAELIALTPISIRAGKTIQIGGSDNPVVRYADGRPYIPASSLKGILRAEAERFARAIGEFVCDIMNPNGENGELKRKDEEKDKYKPCIICKIFGGPTVASHLIIEDALPVDGWRIDRIMRVSINRYTGGQHLGRLFDVEYICPGTKFSWNIRIENLDIFDDTPEAKILKYLFKKLSSGDLYVGGYKSVGFGRIKAEFKNVTKFRLKKDGEIKEEDVTEQFRELILS